MVIDFCRLASETAGKIEERSCGKTGNNPEDKVRSIRTEVMVTILALLALRPGDGSLIVASCEDFSSARFVVGRVTLVVPECIVRALGFTP